MNILVLGAGGFIGGHLVNRLKKEGHWVRGVDIKRHEYFDTPDFCDEFIQGDLRDANFVSTVMYIEGGFDEVYQLAADMGGAGYIFTGENDANVMHNSALINLNVAHEAVKKKVKRLFYSSSACVYPAYNQEIPQFPVCTEDSAIPAAPDSCYGWEKLFSEFLYDAFSRNYGLQVRVARFHNIFGPYGTWKGGKEKAPAAICRKVAEARYATAKDPTQPYLVSPAEIDIWGTGEATRSFLYIDECIEGVIRLMRSDCAKIVNIGSEEMITINDLANMVIKISGKNLTINNIDGPVGVMGRNSDNTLIEKELGWSPTLPLEWGIKRLYSWVEEQVTNG